MEKPDPKMEEIKEPKPKEPEQRTKPEQKEEEQQQEEPDKKKEPEERKEQEKPQQLQKAEQPKEQQNVKQLQETEKISKKPEQQQPSSQQQKEKQQQPQKKKIKEQNAAITAVFTSPPVEDHSPMDTSPEAVETTSDTDRLRMQARTHIRVLPKKLLEKLPADAFKQVVDEADFEDTCKLAAKDRLAAARRMAKFAEPVGAPALVEFATLCLTGPVGEVGSRRALRATAVLLLDRVLVVQPNHAAALCLKGEALLPKAHTGKADPDTPMHVLKEAFALFCKAADTGYLKGKFLKGRWLITMAPVHKSRAKAMEGKNIVRECAEAGVARALLFLAQCYEFPGRFSPVSFSRDLPTSRLQRERVILSMYMRAAELGDADALNDVGSSYATAYGGLKHDFDAAVKYYVRAIQAGSLYAFDNLGTLYETGMSNHFPERIDNAKALHYYQRGAKLRCTKCSANLASAYVDGLAGVLRRDTEKAEQYYRYTILLADDDNDSQTALNAMKDLVGLYMTKLKLSAPNSEAVRSTNKKLEQCLPKNMIAATLTDVNKAITASMRGKERQLDDLLGEYNSAQVSEYARDILDRVEQQNAGPSEEDKVLIEHVFGSFSKDLLRLGSRAHRAKRRRAMS